METFDFKIQTITYEAITNEDVSFKLTFNPELKSFIIRKKCPDNGTESEMELSYNEMIEIYKIFDVV